MSTPSTRVGAGRRSRRWRRPALPGNPGDAPTTWLTTRYGVVRLVAWRADQVVVRGELEIHGAEHELEAVFRRRDERSPFQLGEDLDDQRPVEQRAREIGLRRAWDRPAPSDSARRKATIEVDRVVREWAATPEARRIMRAAARYEKAAEAWSLGIAIGDALRREREARSERLRAARALCELTPGRAPRCSPLSPAQAISIYLARLQVALDETRASAPSELYGLLDRLEALAHLARSQTSRAEDAELWDALTALMEATDD